MAAERYVRTGAGVPKIYPATLASLSRAYRELQSVSLAEEGEHYLEAVFSSERVLLRVYEGGQCTWDPTQNQ